MYGIFESSVTMRRLLKAGFDTIEAAKTYAYANLPILWMEDDIEHDAADFITHGLTIYVIEREVK